MGAGTLTPQMQQALMAMMAGLKGGGPQPPGMAPGTNIPQGQGQGAPQMPQQQPQMPQMGPQGSVLPTGSAVPNVGGVRPSAMPARQPSAISGHGALGMVFGGVMMAKQKMSQDKQQKARAIAGQYIAITNGGGDPGTFMQDPKVHKIFDKALKDPNSPEAQGIQQAYQDVQRQDMQKQQQQLLQQQMLEAQMRMRQMAAQAQNQQALAGLHERSGEVTDQDVFKEYQKNERAREGIKARMQTNSDNIKARQENLKKTLESLEKRAKMHEAGATGRSKARIAQDQATNAVIKQYKNVESRYSALEREQTALDKEIADKPIDSWMTGQDKVFKARSDEINAKRIMLDGQMDTIGASIGQMEKGGVIPKANATPAPNTNGGAPKIIDWTSLTQH